MKLRRLAIVLVVLAVGVSVGCVRTLPVEVVPDDPPGDTGGPGEPVTEPGGEPGLPVPTYLRVDHAMTHEPNEASLRMMDYTQFLDLLARALAGLEEPGVKVEELPFEFWGDLTEGAHRVSATMSHPCLSK